MSEQEKHILRVLRLIDPFECDDIMWSVDGDTVRFMVNCSDVFAWGGADCEEVTPENIGELERAYADVRAFCGSIYASEPQMLFCCRMRQMRPQVAVYTEDSRLWPLFDACGPVREVGLGNPKPHPAEVPA